MSRKKAMVLSLSISFFSFLHFWINCDDDQIPWVNFSFHLKLRSSVPYLSEQQSQQLGVPPALRTVFFSLRNGLPAQRAIPTVQKPLMQWGQCSQRNLGRFRLLQEWRPFVWNLKLSLAHAQVAFLHACFATIFHSHKRSAFPGILTGLGIEPFGQLINGQCSAHCPEVMLESGIFWGCIIF